MSADIKKIRQKIDSLDDEILQLLNERAEQAISIAKENKINRNLDKVIQPEREAQVIRRIQDLIWSFI